ncbi:MAG: DUF5666 domain-containing protein [Anaerolineae bacterium]|nr:DUF5666 domain-containing protein [Anaerolineae bacterium]
MKKIKLAIVTASAASLLIAGAAYAAPPNQTPAPTTQAPAPGKQGQARGGYGDMAHGNGMMQAGPHGQQGLFHGQVSAIDGSNLVFEMPAPPPRRGTTGTAATTTVKIATDASTKFIVTGVASPSLANIKVGDRVTVLLQKPIDRAALKAASVLVMPLPDEAHTGGSVENASASGFTLKTPRSSVKVNVSASTKVIVVGKLNGSIADIANGDKVNVVGKPSSNNVIDATQVVKQGADAVHFGGQIVAINGSVVTLWTPQGDQLSVDVSKAVFVKNRSAADLKVGQHLAGGGVKNADGSITAQITGGGPGGGPGVRGPRGGHRGDSGQNPQGQPKQPKPTT